jgi:hypothetical protein
VAVAVGSSAYAEIVTEDINIVAMIAVSPVITRPIERLKAVTVRRVKARNNIVNRKKDVERKKRKN